LHDDEVTGAPSAVGLLARLVLLPALVVSVLVAGFAGLGWMTFSPRDVDSLVAALERDGNTRWQAAVDLAGTLAEPGGARLKSDPALAGRLIEILHREVEGGGMLDDQIMLRMYLCRALGEFHVPDPLPVLIRAARTERDAAEVDVRCSAIEAITVLASNLGPAGLRTRTELMSVLSEAAEDPRPRLRSRAAFALGVIGGSEAEARLEALLLDGSPDVRYNAATGLARHGNAKVVDVLLEMLDPNELAGIERETEEPGRDFKRVMILTNGLRATRQLASENRTIDIGRLREAVRRLTVSDVEDAVRAEAVGVWSELKDRGPPDRAGSRSVPVEAKSGSPDQGRGLTVHGLFGAAATGIEAFRLLGNQRNDCLAGSRSHPRDASSCIPNSLTV